MSMLVQVAATQRSGVSAIRVRHTSEKTDNSSLMPVQTYQKIAVGIPWEACIHYQLA